MGEQDKRKKPIDQRDELMDKVSECEKILRDVLCVQLDQVQGALAKFEKEIEDYEILSLYLDMMDPSRGPNDIENHQPLTVDLGHGRIHAIAQFDEYPYIAVNLGLGIQAELKPEEAKEFLAKRLQFLSTYRVSSHKSMADKLTKQVNETSTILHSLTRELGVS